MYFWANSSLACLDMSSGCCGGCCTPHWVVVDGLLLDGGCGVFSNDSPCCECEIEGSSIDWKFSRCGAEIASGQQLPIPLFSYI